MQAERLRQAFTKFFVERGHIAVPPSSLIPNDPTVLFTIAGMVPFKAYYTGEAVPPYPRAVTIQPCLRTVDIEIVGTTQRHCTFFEMLGNFSFGDYFKDKAIPWSFEFLTEVLGFDQDRLWVTVHETDDEAAEIWPATTPIPFERVQRLGVDNFWQMGDTGPCGPSSEIFFDRGPEFGPGGGPAFDPSDRYPEIWNLVFTQYDRQADGELTPLPKANIDTGAGLDRLLVILQDVENVQAIDIVASIVREAERLTGRRIAEGGRTETSLRVIADHSRAFTFLVADGVFPSNEGRGYVLRRLIRRVVLRANQLGSKGLVVPHLVDAVVEAMGGAYPKLVSGIERIKKVVVHEEETFLRTLRQGTALLEAELSKGATTIPGDVAFRLHDTFGFPIEVTVEVSGERGVGVDEQGFERAMAEQRLRAKEASKLGATTPEELAAAWRDLRTEHGPTEFLGYSEVLADATVIGVLPSAIADDFANVDGETSPEGSQLLEVFLDRTPFYAEGGGQVGDTGKIVTPTGAFRVLDTTSVLEGLTRHLGYVTDGHIESGSEATAAIDATRRDAIRRNHTGTHLLHWALREVLGDHVRQQGSLVAPDRLRFDFSHFGPLSRDEIERVEDLVNGEVLGDKPVETDVTSRAEAESEGAIAFFGEKYGEKVRVVHAGHGSVELCGGTHVAALGMIGPLRIISERSIASNTRRIEASTGTTTLEMMRAADQVLADAAEVLQSTPLDVAAAAERAQGRQRELEHELATMRVARLGVDAQSLAEEAVAGSGVVVARRDGLDPNAMRDLALGVRDRPGVKAVGLAGVTGDDGRVVLVVATVKGSGIDARTVASAAARAVGGGGGGSPELATAGGKAVAGIGEALDAMRELLGA
jgi:alanyl-tRNA synthetase